MTDQTDEERMNEWIKQSYEACKQTLDYMKEQFKERGYDGAFVLIPKNKYWWDEEVDQPGTIDRVSEEDVKNRVLRFRRLQGQSEIFHEDQGPDTLGYTIS